MESIARDADHVSDDVVSAPAGAPDRHRRTSDDRPAQVADRRTRGRIKWFDARRGFGFIERPGDDDLFVHHTSIRASKNRRIGEGQAVRFLVGPGRHGPEAQDVQLVSA
jgi:CspA family cold shock protein